VPRLTMALCATLNHRLAAGRIEYSAALRFDRRMVHHGGMNEAFIIMQIGNASLETVCDEAIVPAIKDAGFAARRVDRHNAGDLLK
jgi:hypothetical protein